jgi:uncharacterized repeat protein (TIGR01451 family)
MTLQNLTTKTISAAVAVLLLTGGLASAQIVAYDAAVQAGNQPYTGPLGLDFNVLSPIVVTALGTFNSNAPVVPSSGIQVAIFDRASMTIVGPTATFSSPGSETAINGDVFLAVTPFVLPVGQYSIVSVGYSAGNLNGNSTILSPPITLSTENSGGGAIQFVGTGRFDVGTSLIFPTIVPTATPSNVFLSGTFQFSALLPPALTKAFLATSLDVNQKTTLTFTIANSDTIALSGIGFTDTLPAGLIVATPGGLTSTCNGTLTAADGSNFITLSGASLAAGASCTISVTVSAISAGIETNTTSTISSNEAGAGPAATAVLTVGPPLDAYQVSYAANLNIGDSFVDITNAGTSGGNLCANIYTFDPAEELISCCTCSVTPNALQSLSVRNSLISNTLTIAIPTSVVIKITASTGATCNASAVPVASLAAGLRAWDVTIHGLPTSPVTYGATETPFAVSDLTTAELAHLTSFCGFIQADGSGFGICKGCAAGGLGATPAK